MIMWLISGQLTRVVAVNDMFYTASSIANRLIHDKIYKQCHLLFSAALFTLIIVSTE